MIKSFTPADIPVGVYSPGTIEFHIYGEHLDSLPHELCLNCSSTKDDAILRIDVSLGGFHALECISRSDSELVFTNSREVDMHYIVYPYLITTPFATPRSIVMEIQ